MNNVLDILATNNYKLIFYLYDRAHLIDKKLKIFLKELYFNELNVSKILSDDDKEYINLYLKHNNLDELINKRPDLSMYNIYKYLNISESVDITKITNDWMDIKDIFINYPTSYSDYKKLKITIIDLREKESNIKDYLENILYMSSKYNFNNNHLKWCIDNIGKFKNELEFHTYFNKIFKKSKLTSTEIINELIEYCVNIYNYLKGEISLKTVLSRDLIIEYCDTNNISEIKRRELLDKWHLIQNKITFS